MSKDEMSLQVLSVVRVKGTQNLVGLSPQWAVCDASLMTGSSLVDL